MKRMLVLAWLVVAPCAHAADDAGTRSAFAAGAGSRALSMGGAFVGIADDASAPVWNAGGLGRLQRLEVQAAHASYGGDLGLREDYVSVVVPSWRWGAASLIVRAYGIDGAEGRDAGNLLTGDNLSDSELEMGLGFGRPISASLSVGGVVKLQRQSLAGFSGSGLGMDLGVLGRATDRLSWGLSVRNAVQPAIRLDRESVRDPSVVRAGLAYEQPSIFGRPALLAMDLEKSPGVAARLHAGGEIRVHPLLGLRAGVDGGRVTAGMGVAWHDFSVDYAYASQDLSGVHRVGISRALGRSVSEQREASARARDAAIQARLNDAFQKRQDEQLDDLLARARAAQAAGDEDKALELLATVSILYPGQDTAALEALCLREKGKKLEARADYPGAVLAYRRATSLAPADTAAASGLARSLAEADKRASRDESLRRRLAEATAALAADSISRAAAKPLPRVEKVATTTPPPITTPPAPKPLSPEMAREVERLYRAGLGAMAERRLDDALRYWEIAWSMAPGYKNLAEYLKREYLIRGMEAFASGKMEQAIGYWDKAVLVDPNDTRASIYIGRARTQQARARQIMEGSR